MCPSSQSSATRPLALVSGCYEALRRCFVRATLYQAAQANAHILRACAPGMSAAIPAIMTAPGIA